MNLVGLKKSAKEKMNQGDVRIYALEKSPKVKAKPVKDPVLVYGASGNHHKLVGGAFKIKKHEETGALLVEVSRQTSLTHEQHKPPLKLSKGTYLVTRALEKGVYDDLVAPVVD